MLSDSQKKAAVVAGFDLRACLDQDVLRQRERVTVAVQVARVLLQQRRGVR